VKEVPIILDDREFRPKISPYFDCKTNEGAWTECRPCRYLVRVPAVVPRACGRNGGTGSALLQGQ